jgi:hypothetical protein
MPAANTLIVRQGAAAKLPLLVMMNNLLGSKERVTSNASRAGTQYQSQPPILLAFGGGQ